MQVTKEEIAGAIAAMAEATTELKRAHAAYIRAFARRLRSRTEQNYVLEAEADGRLKGAIRRVNEAAVY